MIYSCRFFAIKRRNGFLLGVVLLVSLLMAVLIFSFNAVVRQRNIQAHHLMISETAGYLAISGLRMFTDSMGKELDSELRKSCPKLFNQTAEEIGGSITISSSDPFCSNARNEFQSFLNTLEELREPGILGKYPECISMELTFEDLAALTPDTTPEQFQAGRDAIEKCGMVIAKCTVEYRGLKRQAVMKRQFRVVSMLPGPFSRFSLFVKKTPYPDSYNALGVTFDGNIDNNYLHMPASKTFSGPLVIFNGTDSVKVDNEIAARDEQADRRHLRSRGWVFIGPAGNDKDEAVFLNIPSGFTGMAGGHFMFGWPSKTKRPILAPEIIVDEKNFASDKDFPEHEFRIGGAFQGFYTWEEGNPYGAGARNLWPGMTAGEKFIPSDHLRSASTWLYPFGNSDHESRTLVVGPVLAGFLRFFFIEGQNTSSGNRYKGLWGRMTDMAFNSNIANNQPLPGFTDLWGGKMLPAVTGTDFFLNGYESYKKIMPYNSLPSPSSVMPGNGVAFNLIFDFMKYKRDHFPDLNSAPGISAAEYDFEEFLVPHAEEMRNAEVKGLHPHDEISLYLKENGLYSPDQHPDNCYFTGNLADITVYNSSLVSSRITHKLDLTKCESLEEEQVAFEKFLFAKVQDGSKNLNQTDKSGIFLIARRKGITDSFADALTFSRLPVKLVKPLIVVVDSGSLVISNDIISSMSNGAPSVLCSLALVNGHFFIDGKGYRREIHAYLASLHQSSGRLLKPMRSGGPTGFVIRGGLALTEIGLYESPVNDPLNHFGTTMSHFSNGGEIHYNPLFNPSSLQSDDARVFIIEDTAGRCEITGALQ